MCLFGCVCEKHKQFKRCTHHNCACPNRAHKHTNDNLKYFLLLFACRAFTASTTVLKAKGRDSSVESGDIGVRLCVSLLCVCVCVCVNERERESEREREKESQEIDFTLAYSAEEGTLLEVEATPKSIIEPQ